MKIEERLSIISDEDKLRKYLTLEFAKEYYKYIQEMKERC